MVRYVMDCGVILLDVQEILLFIFNVSFNLLVQ